MLYNIHVCVEVKGTTIHYMLYICASRLRQGVFYILCMHQG